MSDSRPAPEQPATEPDPVAGDPVERAPAAPGRSEPAGDLDDLFPGLPETTSPEERSPALRLARIHLRNGAALLARAELESLEGEGRLDRTGLLDLAECCWRAGDLEAAAGPIERYLAAGGRDPLGFVIAAEGAAAHGRPTEARRFAGRARAAADLDLDRVFAGEPRSDVWPSSSPSLEETLFRLPGLPEPIHGGGSTGPAGGSPVPAERGPRPATDLAGAPAPTPGPAGSGASDSPGAGGGAEQPGFWDGPEAVAPGGLGSEELATALAALGAGDETAAALSFGVALRLDSGHAARILRATGGAGGPAMMLVRGDAYRVLGDEVRARAAYAAAAMRPPPSRPAREAIPSGPDGPLGEMSPGPEPASAEATSADTRTDPPDPPDPPDPSDPSDPPEPPSEEIP